MLLPKPLYLVEPAQSLFTQLEWRLLTPLVEQAMKIANTDSGNLLDDLIVISFSIEKETTNA